MDKLKALPLAAKVIIILLGLVISAVGYIGNETVRRVTIIEKDKIERQEYYRDSDEICKRLGRIEDKLDNIQKTIYQKK